MPQTTPKHAGRQYIDMFRVILRMMDCVVFGVG